MDKDREAKRVETARAEEKGEIGLTKNKERNKKGALGGLQKGDCKLSSYVVALGGKRDNGNKSN